MSNIAQVMKQEISRLAKKEIRTATAGMKKDSVRLKKANADIKKRIAMLEKDNRRLIAAEERRLQEQPAVAPEKAEKARTTAKGMRSLRKKLGLSAAQFAALLGTSTQTVYNWEKSEGALKLMGATKAAVLSVRNIGAREAKARLESIAAKKVVVKRLQKRGK